MYCDFPVHNAVAEADSGIKFDNTSVLDDLKSSTINGQTFDIKNYPYNEKKTIKVIDFVEYCYSYRTNQRANFGLYLYIYNSQGLNLSIDSKRNKVQMAVNYDSDGKPIYYEKFDLKFAVSQLIITIIYFTNSRL